MKSNKFLKITIIVLASIFTLGGIFVFYIYNTPHRDVQESKTDYVLTASQLIAEYLADPLAANNKYLDSDGESKIIEVQGQVFSISEDYNNNNAETLVIGNTVILKGVIRSGASYDSDLEMYENVIMEKCDEVKNK